MASQIESREEQTVKHLMALWEAVAYLFGELHHLLEGVIVDATSPTGVMTASHRQQELETVISLLKHVQSQAPARFQYD